MKKYIKSSEYIPSENIRNKFHDIYEFVEYLISRGECKLKDWITIIDTLKEENIQSLDSPWVLMEGTSGDLYGVEINGALYILYYIQPWDVELVPEPLFDIDSFYEDLNNNL